MRGMRARGTSADLGLALVLLLTGCYASHGRDDAGAALVPDAPRRDAPERDAPARDVAIGLPDTPVTLAACARDRDCTTGLCVLDRSVRPADHAAVPLGCGSAGSLAPGTECETNDECENGLCALAGGCVEPCLDALDCRDGERCTEVPVVTSPIALQTAMACVRWVDAPATVTVSENASIPVTPFGAQLYSLPASAGGHRLVLHVADQYADFRSIDRVALSGAGGATLFDIGALGPQINPAAAFFDLAPILVPNAPWPSGLDARGALGYAITAGGETELQRIVLDHEGTGTTLDLNVFFVGVRRDARADRTLRNMLLGYGDILATFGVRVGRVREREVVGSSASTFAVLDDEVEAGELFRMSAGAARPAVNVFLVSSSPLFLGLAGGIPGAQTVHGTRASGIALSFDDLQAALDAGLPIELLSMVLAHELGHFSGLFHTTEADGSSSEPLPDTARCDISADTDGDGMLMAEECLDRDGTNIMFWGASQPGSTFSTTQRDVLRAAPVLLP